MLQTLKIENVALIDKATLTFDDKLNVISGETGSGKSIMLDSLSFVFGGRADRTLIRQGEESMKVEAVFVNLNQNVVQFIQEELNISCEAEMFLSRELDLKGKNICKINGELVPIAMVKKVCLKMVDLHGQSEHQAILSNEYQLEIIDLYSREEDGLKDKLNSAIDNIEEIETQIKALGGSATEKQNLIDLYAYQINEIMTAKVTENEYEDLLAEKKEMSQFEKINECLKSAYEMTAKNNFSESASEKLAQATKALVSLSEISEHYRELYDRLHSALIEVNDISDTIYDSLSSNVFNQERFDYVDSRIDLIKSLFRKYGGDYASMTKYFDDISLKYENLIQGEERYEELIAKREIHLENIRKIQDRLTEVRKKSAIDLSKRLESELKTLGMPDAKIDIIFDKISSEYSRNGQDRVEYMFSANLGFDLKPLNKVVSGGEMSRVMLAYKIVVASVDDIDTIIFDEIDSGLSGSIATVVAEYMARLSVSKQIIAISHLPQICAMADYNIKVQKYTENNTTHTIATILKDDLLYEEIARLMGVVHTDNALLTSKDLKQKSELYKENLK